jgi:flagellar protein FliS
MHARELNIYKKVFVESAPPDRLLDELLARLLRDIEDAKRHIATKNVKAKAESIDHGLRILTELSLALNPEVAPELCANLAGLYEFASRQLLSANIGMELAPLEQAAKLVGTIREAFATAASQR